MNHNSRSLYISHTTCPKNFFGVLVVGACCLPVDSGGFLIILLLYGPIVIISQLRCVDKMIHTCTHKDVLLPRPDHVETRVLRLLLSSCGTCATAVAPQNQ